MPPIYELSRPYFYYHDLKSRREVLRKVGGEVLDITSETSEAGLYMVVRIISAKYYEDYAEIFLQ